MIPFFLDAFLKIPSPEGYNVSDWILYHASTLSPDQKTRGTLMSAQLYELMYPGYSRHYVPLIDFPGKSDMSDGSQVKVLCVDKRKSSFSEKIVCKQDENSAYGMRKELRRNKGFTGVFK